MTGYIKNYFNALYAKLTGDDKKKLRAINDDRTSAWKKFFYMKSLVDFYAENMDFGDKQLVEAMIMASEIKCPVCYDEIVFEKVEVNKCKHIICSTCYDGCVEHHKPCPLCRANWELIYTSH
jgi:hypothetical protein